MVKGEVKQTQLNLHFFISVNLGYSTIVTDICNSVDIFAILIVFVRCNPASSGLISECEPALIY